MKNITSYALNFLIFFMMFFTCFIRFALSEEPEIGKEHYFHSGQYSWKIETPKDLTLSVLETATSKQTARYDLNGCNFCSGKDDNCEVDGISEAFQKSEPILIAICHVGAHSQQLQILAPKRNNEQAVFSVTGAYWVNYQVVENKIIILHDETTGNGGFKEQEVIWHK